MTTPLTASSEGDRDSNAGKPAYICALAVTFNPDPERLRAVLAAIAPQVQAVLVVDNGSARSPADDLRGAAGGNAHLLCLGDNTGIACAQNLGLAWARAQGATHVLTLDQDAVAPPGMVAALLGEMVAREARGERVAAVGPLVSDPRRASVAPFFRIAPIGMHRITAPDPGEPSARVDFLISAGSLIRLQALDEIGEMDEALFIDYVDLEWCMRATHRGYRLYGHYGTRIDHRLGEEPLRFLGRRFMNHSPLRHYYMARNALALWRMPHARPGWIVFDMFAACVRLVVFGIAAPQRVGHLRMMLRGFADALGGRYGRQDQAATGWRVPEQTRRRLPQRL